MLKPAGEVHFQARLIRIEFPGVHVNHHWNSALIPAFYTPAGQPVRIKPEVSATGEGDMIHDREVGLRKKGYGFPRLNS